MFHSIAVFTKECSENYFETVANYKYTSGWLHYKLLTKNCCLHLSLKNRQYILKITKITFWHSVFNPIVIVQNPTQIYNKKPYTINKYLYLVKYSVIIQKSNIIGSPMSHVSLVIYVFHHKKCENQWVRRWI